MFFVKVEAWLNRVLDTMRSTVRHEMTEAVMAYEDKPREQWLFDYPAQVNRLSRMYVCMDLTDDTRFGDFFRHLIRRLMDWYHV